MRKTSSVSAPESDEVGSSKISSDDPCWIARQISTICFPAGLSLPTRHSARRGKRCSSISRAARSVMRRRFTQPRGSRSSRPRKMFSATVRWGARSDSWCTIAIPIAAASDGLLRNTSLPRHNIRPLSRSCIPGDDLHERGFAGAVLAEQQMNFARVDREIPVAERGDTAKAFLNFLEFEQHRKAPVYQQRPANP